MADSNAAEIGDLGDLGDVDIGDVDVTDIDITNNTAGAETGGGYDVVMSADLPELLPGETEKAPRKDKKEKKKDKKEKKEEKKGKKEKKDKKEKKKDKKEKKEEEKKEKQSEAHAPNEGKATAAAAAAAADSDDDELPPLDDDSPKRRRQPRQRAACEEINVIDSDSDAELLGAGLGGAPRRGGGQLGSQPGPGVSPRYGAAAADGSPAAKRRRARASRDAGEAPPGDEKWDEWESSDDGREVPKAHELALTALRAGMPGKFLMPEEAVLFRELTGARASDAERKKYLHTRNVLLWMWNRHPDRRLYLRALRERVHPQQLLAPHSVYRTLDETGWINYGVPRERCRPIEKGRTVVVVGAGISGLVAAQHLRRGGFTVILLEARKRVGGRCHDHDFGRGVSVPVGPWSEYDLPEMVCERVGGDDDAMAALMETKKATGLIDIQQSLDALKDVSKLKVDIHHEGKVVQVHLPVVGATVAQLTDAVAPHRQTLRLPAAASCPDLDFTWSYDQEPVNREHADPKEADGILQGRIAGAGPHSFHCRARPVWQEWDGRAVPAQTKARRRVGAVGGVGTKLTVAEVIRIKTTELGVILMVKTLAGSDTMEWSHGQGEGVIELQEVFNVIDEEESMQEARAQRLNRDPLKRARVILYNLLRQAGVPDSWFVEKEKANPEDMRYQTKPDCEQLQQKYDNSGKLVTESGVTQAAEHAHAQLAREVEAGGTHGAAKCEAAILGMKPQVRLAGTQLVEEWEAAAHATLDSVGLGALAKPVGSRSLMWRGRLRLPPGVTWKRVCTALARRLDVRMGRRVTRVVRSGANGDAVVQVTHAAAPPDDGVRVDTRTAEEVEADHIIITAPIGVLQQQRGGIRFEPELCEAKANAIRAIGAGCRNVLVLRYTTAWWAGMPVRAAAGGGAGTTGNMLTDGELVLQRDVRGTLPRYRNAWAGRATRGVGGRCVLASAPVPYAVFTLSGEGAKEAERRGSGDLRPDDPLVLEATDHFDRIFPAESAARDEAGRLPRPIARYVSRWKSDRYAACSAPFCRPETLPEHFEALGGPDDRDDIVPIHFAGDAAQYTGHGTLYAAVESGVKAASRVMDDYNARVQREQVRPRPLSTADRLLDLRISGSTAAGGRARAHDDAAAHGRRKGGALMTSMGAVGQAAQLTGSSRNLKAKYSSTDAMPLLQRNLFTTQGPVQDEVHRKRTGVNWRAAAAQGSKQVAIAKLERFTEGRVRVKRATEEEGIARQLAIRAKQEVARKRDVRGQITNVVDDGMPTWCYQFEKTTLVAEHGRHPTMEETFYSSKRESALHVAEGAKRRYMQQLLGAVHSALERHTLPALAAQSGVPCSVFARETFTTRRQAIFAAALKRLQLGVLRRERRSHFELGDWSLLPRLDDPTVLLALRNSVDASMAGFVDPRAPEAGSLERLATTPTAGVPPRRDGDGSPSASVAPTRTPALPADVDEYRSIPGSAAPGSPAASRDGSPERRAVPLRSDPTAAAAFSAAAR